jgi:glycosyltransferase involved in cell wall biosynthesis
LNDALSRATVSGALFFSLGTGHDAPRFTDTRAGDPMKLSVIIPVYNEVDTVLEIIAQVRACGVSDLELVVVDDCSTDGTADKLAGLPPASDLIVLRHDVNRGKGAAIRTAQARVSGDAVVIQDADLEYSPVEFPTMFRLIADGRADAVFGSRYSGSEILVDSFWHYFGNRLLTFVSNVCANIHLTDMETCYKMVRGEIFRELKLECNRFGFEPELTAKLARRRCRIYEVPIAYAARRFDEGKKIGWRDGFAALWYILKYNLLQ